MIVCIRLLDADVGTAGVAVMDGRAQRKHAALRSARAVNNAEGAPVLAHALCAAGAYFLIGLAV